MSASKQTDSKFSNSTINHWMIKSTGVGETAESLWDAAVRYFMWCEKNPIHKQEMIKQTGAVVDTYLPRPYNLPAFCVHTGVSAGYILDCASRKESGDYYHVAQRILQVIYAQKYEYAVVGIFNPVIVGKDLKLDSAEEVKRPAIINISVDESGPPLITDEQNVIL